MAEEWYRRYSPSPLSWPPGAISSFHGLLRCWNRQAFRTGANVANSGGRTAWQCSYELTALALTAEATVLLRVGGSFYTLISPVFWSYDDNTK